ncbi:hypothetical protein V8E52_008021 [Russula decolorans]
MYTSTSALVEFQHLRQNFLTKIILNELPFPFSKVEDSATSNLENPNTTSLATSPTLSQIPDAASSPPPFGRAKGKRRIFEVDTPDDSDSAPDGARSTVHPQAKKARNSATLGNPDASIDDNNSPGNVDRTQDVKEFFHPAFSKEITGTILESSPMPVPVDAIVKQNTLLFQQAAIEWLVATDQPIQALEHLAFKEMINVTFHATNGVKIPGRKATRNEIKSMFKKHLMSLKLRLNSEEVSGKINLTCDAWQAGNTKGYFAVTSH